MPESPLPDEPDVPEKRPPRINVELLTPEERRLLADARVIAAARGEPLRDFVIRALGAEVGRTWAGAPDLMEALARLRDDVAQDQQDGAYSERHERARPRPQEVPQPAPAP